jgi:putative ABC transport system ATP-binding protein
VTAPDSPQSPLIAEGIGKVLTLPNGSSRFALEDVSLTLRPRTISAIVGRSGCGKTTLLHILGLLAEPDHGSLTVLGRQPSALTAAARAGLRRETLGFVFQAANLVPQLSALDNVLLAAAASGPDVRRRAFSLLHQVGLTRQLRNRPAELSAGEQQRVAFARAMINGAPIILADEPTGNLDEANEHLMMRQFRAYSDEGNAVLLVTHSESVASAADVVLQMAEGRLR